jgi:hypothetical protein
MMDSSSLSKMQNIPPPQRELGWQFAMQESRPYMPGVDDLDFIETRGTVHDEAVWVFTNTGEFANWDEARQDAIKTMVDIDMRRTPPEIPGG